jgi:hypothetical protein
MVGAEQGDTVAARREPAREVLDVELRAAAFRVRLIAPVEEQDVTSWGQPIGALPRYGDLDAEVRGLLSGDQRGAAQRGFLSGTALFLNPARTRPFPT